MKKYVFLLLMVSTLILISGCNKVKDIVTDTSRDNTSMSNDVTEENDELSNDETEEIFNEMAELASDAADEYSDDSESEYETDEWEEDSEEIINYDNAIVVNLPEGYPNDIVPIFESAKVIYSSAPPSKDAYIVELILPEGSYKDAIKFYKAIFNLEPEDFKSEVMETARFSGTEAGWDFEVFIGTTPAINLTSVTITLDK